MTNGYLFREFITITSIALMMIAIGCNNSKSTSVNSAASSSLKPLENANSTARTGSQPESMNIQEPDRYSITMTISAQAMTADAPAPMMTQQLTLARFDSDRRWGFVLPAPAGQVVYLEKSGLKYLVFYDRKQYAELEPNTLGFQIGRALTPNGAVERLKGKPHEKLGLEPINGRTAIKYRSTEPRESATTTDVIFVDQDTGMPLRSELNIASPNNKWRMIVEVRDVQLNPDRAQFDVPAGMKKVTIQEARQQIDSVATTLRMFVDIVNGTEMPVSESAASGANRNAVKGVR